MSDHLNTNNARLTKGQENKDMHRDKGTCTEPSSSKGPSSKREGRSAMLDEEGTRQNHKKEDSAANSHITAFNTSRMARADDLLPISA